jgi:hypothetical protein
VIAVARSRLQISHADKLCDYRRRRNRSLEADYTAHCDTPQTAPVALILVAFAQEISALPTSPAMA